MPDSYFVEISSPARKELREIHRFISRTSIQNASKMMSRLLDAMESLSLLPHRYDVPRTGYSRGRSIRAMPVSSFIIRYRIDESKKLVIVLHVRHGARRKP